MEVAEIEAALGEVCGQLNAAHARLVALVAEVLASRCWEGAGILTCAQWVAWKTGLSPHRASEVVALAARQGELPATMTAFSAGELAVDQVVVVARHVPPDCEAQAADLARLATVSQLRRSLSTYNFHPEPAPDPVQPQPDPCGVSGWYDAQGRWRLRACLEADQGAIVAAALAEARDALFNAGDPHVTGPEVLVEMAQRSLDAVPGASRRDTYRVMVHVEVGGAHLHDGPALPDAWRQLILCDTTGVIVGVRDGRPIDVGRRRHIVPVALRRTIERRDRGAGCRAVLAAASRSITSCIGNTAARPPPTIWSASARSTIGCTTRVCSASPATPTGRMD
ncbi:MAG TPA: DUF222 domain-containing protein [Acidimicrobiales bacterium]|nr:DUF222 domain-containing protein [Acidimicrobiales bacterium]